LRINKDSLVVMKEKKVNTLYILQGSTVTAAAAVSMSKDPDLNTTHL